MNIGSGSALEKSWIRTLAMVAQIGPHVYMWNSGRRFPSLWWGAGSGSVSARWIQPCKGKGWIRIRISTFTHIYIHKHRKIQTDSRTDGLTNRKSLTLGLESFKYVYTLTHGLHLHHYRPPPQWSLRQLVRYLPRLRPSKTLSKIHSDEKKRNIDMLNLYTIPRTVLRIRDPVPFWPLNPG